MDAVGYRRIVAGTLATVLVVAIAYWVSDDPIDFRVYYLGSTGLFDGSRPVYGEYSGMGWPMHYRYPPLFLLLVAPLTLLPVRISATLWLVAKLAVLVLLVRAIWRRLGPRWNLWAVLIPVLVVTPYLILDFRYGNVQLFIFGLTAAALLWSDSRPWGSAFALSLAISVKVWPLFFVPYLLALRRYRVAAASLALTAALTVLPAVYLGGARTLDLLAEWADQELVTQAGEITMWFPSQSLGGVLTRYLTFVDYSAVPDGNYPAINVADIDAGRVRVASIVAVALVYGAFLVGMRRRGGDSLLLSGALAFCLVALLEPHTQRHALVLLLWPALVAGRLTEARVRPWILAATVLIALQPLLPGSATQRLFQTLGADFLAVALLAIAMTLALYHTGEKGSNPLNAEASKMRPNR
jgi:hypothetical protein